MARPRTNRPPVSKKERATVKKRRGLLINEVEKKTNIIFVNEFDSEMKEKIINYIYTVLFKKTNIRDVYVHIERSNSIFFKTESGTILAVTYYSEL